jgi:hypothetical protein
MNEDAAVALQVIYMYFRERGAEWPTFAHFEHWLHRYRKQEAVQVIKRIPDDLLKPLTFLDGQPDPGGRLILTAKGLDRCRGSDDDRQNLIAAVQYLEWHYTNYDLAENSGVRGVPISTRQLAADLKLPLLTDPNSVQRLLVLLKGEGLVMSDEYS